MSVALKRGAGKVVESRGVVKQFLTFLAEGELFGMNIESVREVIEYPTVTEVPLMPPFVKGVVNLRGDVVPIIDLAVRFGKAQTQVDRRTCIVIVEIQHDEEEQIIGMVVEAVSEVVEISDQDIEPPPAFGARIRSEFIEGVAKVNGAFAVLLSASHVLSIDEMSAIVEADIAPESVPA